MAPWLCGSPWLLSQKKVPQYTYFIKYTAAVFSQLPYWLVESISCNVRLWFPLYPSEFWKAPNKTVGAKVGLIFDISKLKELSWKNLLYYKTLQYSTKQYIAVNNRNYTVSIILSNVKSVYFTTGNCRLLKQCGKLRNIGKYISFWLDLPNTM